MLECLSPSRHVECDRHEELCKFTSAGVQALSTDSRLKEMKAEYKFFSRHVDRRNHFLAFMKCDDCEVKCHHCSKNAIQSKKSMAVLRKCGGSSRRHQTATILVTSCRTKTCHCICWPWMKSLLLLTSSSHRMARLQIAVARAATSTGLQHQRLAHGGAASKALAEHACSYSSEDGVCGLQFHYYALMKHKTTIGHKCSRGRPKKN